MVTLTNDIRADMKLVIKQGANFSYYFQDLTINGVLIDFALAQEIRIDVTNAAGHVVANYLVGDGLEIDQTYTKRIFMSKAANEKNIARGDYQWEMKVKYSDAMAQYPVGGPLVMIKSIKN